MPYCAGIDLSTYAIEIVRLDENGNHGTWDHLQLDGHDALARLRDVGRKMPRWADSWWDDCYLLAVEAPMGRGNAGAVAKLSRVFGAIVACVPPTVPIWELAPHDWRRELEVPGNAAKTVCAARAIELGACPTWADENAYDAYAIAYAAREINHRGLEAA